MRQAGQPWLYRCPKCRTQASTLPVDIDGKGSTCIDEVLRERGLETLRRANNRRVVARLLDRGVRPGGTVLDVGCAHGWFLEEAGTHGLEAIGIEPDRRIAEIARTHGRSIRSGYFPDALVTGETFDAIVFNDVIEHLPDPRSAVEACRAHLASGGLLSLNLPTRSGLIYRCASAMARLRIRGPHHRLWQVGMPSPHLWYFDRAGIISLCEHAGLQFVASAPLDTVERSGLWARVTMSGVQVGSLLAATTGGLAAPLLNRGRCSDIMHVICQTPDGDLPTVARSPRQLSQQLAASTNVTTSNKGVPSS